MQEYNLCRYPMTLNEELLYDCAAPYQQWHLIVAPKPNPNGQVVPDTLRGISVQGIRFRYKYTCIAQPATIAISIMRFWSGVVVAPCDGLGTPLSDPLTGGLPIFGNVTGDTVLGARVMWRGLDHVGVQDNAAVNISFLNFNSVDRYMPLEHVRSKAFLPEGKALYFVTEWIPGTDGISFTSALDLTMSLAVKARS